MPFRLLARMRVKWVKCRYGATIVERVGERPDEPPSAVLTFKDTDQAIDAMPRLLCDPDVSNAGMVGEEK